MFEARTVPHLKPVVKVESSHRAFFADDPHPPEPGLRVAYADFLSQFKWAWFFTGTFGYRARTPAVWRCWHRYLQRIRKSMKGPVDRNEYGDIPDDAYEDVELASFAVMERGKLRGTPHLHAFVAGVEDLPRAYWWKDWFDRTGRAELLPYDPTRGAAYYLTKYVLKEASELGEYELEGSLATFTV